MLPTRRPVPDIQLDIISLAGGLLTLSLPDGPDGWVLNGIPEIHYETGPGAATGAHISGASIIINLGAAASYPNAIRSTPLDPALRNNNGAFYAELNIPLEGNYWPTPQPPSTVFTFATLAANILTLATGDGATNIYDTAATQATLDGVLDPASSAAPTPGGLIFTLGGTPPSGTVVTVGPYGSIWTERGNLWSPTHSITIP